jgi:transcriptional regulator with XRE-family HTH domain
MDIRNAVAANIRSVRARRNIGQERLAGSMRALGFSAWLRQTVSMAERGERRISVEEIFGLARVLDTTVMSLMDMSDNGAVHFPDGSQITQTPG